MIRAYELLVIEQIQKGGFMTVLQDAWNHIGNGNYSYKKWFRNSKEAYIIVTVVFAHYMVAVYYIDQNTHEIELVGSLGVNDHKK